MSRPFHVFVFLALGAVCLALTGCIFDIDAIALSNASYDFGLNTSPWYFQVWNASPGEVPELSYTVSTDRSWLTCTPTSGTSSGAADRDTITVTVNRSGLSAGQHTATITVSGRRIATKKIAISVTSEGGSDTVGGWSLANVTSNYTAPYLLEFDFSLRDENDHAVIAEPAQFEIECVEDAALISSETDAHLAKGANKQLKTYLVLDYTLSMADRTINGDLDGNGRSDAIDKMETAAKTTYLDALNEDAQVGIYEFHRGDRDPQKVADFSTDKNYLKGRIDAIWTEYVQNFPAESRCWDALFAAVGEFSAAPEARRDEQRAIVFLSDGADESSTHTYQDAIDAARNKGIAFYCIGFGAELDMSALRVMTSQTGGKYYSATTVDELATQFAQIINDLGGQYILRWATLKRTSQSFMPSFILHISGHDLRYAAAPLYRPTDHAGNPLEGTLRMVSSDSSTQSTAYLRAAYVPRYITALSLYVESAYAYTASLVEAGAGGLCDPAAWILTQTPEGAGMRIVIESTNPDDIFTALPFGAFGSILKFEFGEIVDPTLQFTTLTIDNTLYSGGQTFVFLAE